MPLGTGRTGLSGPSTPLSYATYSDLSAAVAANGGRPLDGTLQARVGDVLYVWDATIGGYVPTGLSPYAMNKYGSIALGDSIAAQNPGCIVTSLYLRERVVIKNMGVAGNKSQDVVNRLDAVIAENPQEVVLHVGINDWLNSISPDVTIANILNIYDRLLANGIVTHIVIPPPTSVSAYTAGAYDGNKKLEAALLRRGIAYYTPWAQFCNPLTGGWISGAADVDGIHPKVITQNTAAKTLASQINSHDGFLSDRIPVLCNRGAFANPLMLTDAAGVATGLSTVVPTGITYQCADFDGIFGRAQRVIVPEAVRSTSHGIIWYAPGGIFLPGNSNTVSMAINPKSASNSMGVDIAVYFFNAQSQNIGTEYLASRWRVTGDEVYKISRKITTPSLATAAQVILRMFPDSTSVASEFELSFGEMQVFPIGA